MTQIALGASARGRARLLLVLLMLAALVILAIALAFTADPALQHSGLGHTLVGALASEGGPPPGH